MSFVHLHQHTQYSLLDGASRPKALARRVAELGMPACAITDHGNLFGAVEFHDAMRAEGVKPIIGCEMYMALGSRFERSGPEDQQADAGSNNHLIVLAENETGWRNLVKLVSAGFMEGFYYKPRIDKELLDEHREGLICLSSCLKGEVSQALAFDDYEKAKKAALEFKEILGKENFYLEIQDHGIPDQQKIIPAMEKLSKELDLDLVATNDSHYLVKEDAFAHEVLLAIGTGKTLDDDRRMRFHSDDFFIKTPEQMREVFRDYPAAIDRTLEIADRIDLTLDSAGYQLPEFDVPSGYDSDSYFVEIVEKGLEKRFEDASAAFEKGLKNHPPADYHDRLEKEITIIRNMGFQGYFLVVWDFIRFARENGIPVGPGRGSAAGSLVAYSMGITNVDPLDFDLLFERFLNPERISMPDIDIDFCMNQRGRVIEYVRDRYGTENVAQIITFGTMAARSVVRDVGRVLGMSYAAVDKIAKMIPAGETTLSECRTEVPMLVEAIRQDDQVEELLDIAERLEGLTRHAGMHAAGVVITPKPVTEYAPLFRTNRDEIVTQFDMRVVEQLGLLKMDFLGLRTLTVIDQAVKGLELQEGIHVDIDDIPFDDEETFRIFQEGRTKGIFQFESGGMVDLLRRVRPEKFEDLAALNALYRPGALDAGMVDEFVKRKNGRSKPRYLVPVMKEILEETYGVIVYQEQVMEIAREVAGFSLGEADLLRKAMGKKKREIMEEQRAKFVTGALDKGYDQETANAIFDYIEPFARYGFNKSHSVAYALIAYQTAWLKGHHPRHFMAALMSSEMDKTDSVVKFINEASSMGIPVLPPDINESNEAFTVVGENVRFGLAAVKGVGSSAVEAILAARRTTGRFSSLDDFCENVDLRTCNRKVIEALIKSGSFDSLGQSRRYMAENLERISERAVRAHEEKAAGQGNLFGGANVEAGSLSTAAKLEAEEEWEEEEKLGYEKETLGFYITGHPLDKFSGELSFFGNATTASLVEHVDDVVHIGGIVGQLKTNRIKKGRNEGKLMARMVLDDQHGTVDAVVFSDMFQKAQSWLENGLPVLVTATVKDSGGVPAGRSVALAAAEREAQRLDDEYGGHPEGLDAVESERENIVQPELNVIDIVRLEGIQDAKVRLLCLEMAYARATPERIQQLRDILEDHRGAIPVQVRLRDIPEELRKEVNGGEDSMRLRINPHFGVRPGPELKSAVEQLEAELVYSF